ncbi:unnamed protein product [Closterium sp. Yama58-4]|nr:unnamed protein product [Closterium sp. Yama58-4]
MTTVLSRSLHAIERERFMSWVVSCYTFGVIIASIKHDDFTGMVAMDTTDSHERDIDVEPMLKRQREDSSQKTDTQDDTDGQPDSSEARDREPSPAVAEAHKRIEEFTQKDP